MDTQRSRLRIVLILLLAAVPLLSTRPALSQETSPSCSEIVNRALDAARERCEAAGRNEACYGHVQLEAQPQPGIEQFKFDQEGDITAIPSIRSLRLSAMQNGYEVWGVALMRVRTNSINLVGQQDATMLLFGDVQLTNGVQPESNAALFTVHTKGKDARVRNTPWGGTISAVADGDTVTANGRLADGSWVRIELPFTSGRSGWIHASLIGQPEALDRLDVVKRDSALYAPMQAFYFQSGQDGAACQAAPDSGLLIQTPEGAGRIVFLINEVVVDLGSTVYFRATPGQAMTVSVVEGSARVQARNQASYAVAGSQITIPLDDQGAAKGPPSPPKAYDKADVDALPIQQLDRLIDIHPPLEDDEIDVLLRMQDELAMLDALETGPAIAPDNDVDDGTLTDPSVLDTGTDTAGNEGEGVGEPDTGEPSGDGEQSDPVDATGVGDSTDESEPASGGQDESGTVGNEPVADQPVPGGAVDEEPPNAAPENNVTPTSVPTETSSGMPGQADRKNNKDKENKDRRPE